MDFEFSEQQRMVRDMVRAFAAERLRPGAGARDASGEFPADIFRELGELGLLGMMTPEAYGGAGTETLAYLLAVEEIAHFGSEELKGRVLPPLARGEVLGGIMLTEPGAGSDLASLRTTYRRDGDRFLLSGSKVWITNAGIGAYFVVLATRDAALGAKGISAFVLDARQQGVLVQPREKKMGLRSSVTAAVILEDAAVPVANMLGSEGEGMKVALATLDHSRLGIAAQAIGVAQAALDEALTYAKQREQFGRPIIEHEAVGFRLADMDAELEAARWLTYRAAWLSERPGRLGRTSAQAKLVASETVNRVVAAAVQVHGGYGYSREFAVERLYRDARVTTIYEGTSEVQRMVIARALRNMVTTATA
ncbi:MAG: hypothetical protein B7Z68_12685 [Acidobacteria bacterium 21-70-11]|nr:MAG: hypothetical protein B7Z68_12685 [Acidobacteria bacterium 21-70-11]